MIYFFTGNNDYQIRDEVGKWKEKFLSKYGDFNLFHIKDIASTSKNYLAEALLSQSFFSDKKLIIIEGYPSSSQDKETSEEIDTFFMDQLKTFPEENIILFVSASPDKRTKIYKELISIAEVRDFSFHDENAAITFLYERFKKVATVGAIKLLFEYKWGNISKTVNEIEKLSLYTQETTEKDVREFVLPEIDQSIFMIIDALLARNLWLFFRQLQNLSTQMSVYAFYNAFLSNLRNSFYIHSLKHLWVPSQKIGGKLWLWNKAFLVNKPIKLHYLELERLYVDLIKLDKKMKSGKMIGSDDEDFIYEIEKVILKNLS